MAPTSLQITRHWSLLLMILLIAPFGCDSAGPSAPDPVDEPDQLTLAAGESRAFLSLGPPQARVSVTEPSESGAWDLGVLHTSVMVNGGDAGPGGLEAHCVCQHQALSAGAVMALDTDAARTAFDAVTIDDIPAGEDAWTSDTLVPTIDGWYDYDLQTHTVSADPGAVWKLRLADGSGFARVHVVAIEDAAREHAGTVTLEYAVQSAAGAVMGPDRTITVDLAQTGSALVDLEAGALTTDPDAWDLRLQGYMIRVNGGVSGPGQAGAVAVEDSYGAVADAGDMTASHYQADTYGGVFSSGDPGARWYRYDLDGQHQIWPTYNVYLIRRGDQHFKVQVTGYYNDEGDARHVTIRSAPLGE